MTPQHDSVIKLGQISHVGIAVKDLDKAVEYYSSVFGIGPFKTQVYEMNQFIYRGKPANARVRAAIANCGPVFIELVQVLEGETPHTEFLRKKGEGIQHIAFRVDGLEAKLAELAKQGIEPVMRYRLLMEPPADSKGKAGGRPNRGRVELNEVYLNSERIGGAMIQLMEFKRLPLE